MFLNKGKNILKKTINPVAITHFNLYSYLKSINLFKEDANSGNPGQITNVNPPGKLTKL